MPDMTFVGKLSVATTGMTGFGKKNLPEEGGKTLVCGRFYGIARGIVWKQNTDGTKTAALEGDFIGHSYRATDEFPEGEMFRSNILYLPGGQQDALTNLWLTVKEEDRPTAVEFAIEVGVIKAANPQGYSWVGRPLMESSVRDPIADFAMKLRPTPLQLARQKLLEQEAKTRGETAHGTTSEQSPADDKLAKVSGKKDAA